ncbi:aminoglycoside phosphotransferase family protein [Microvirga puerhi]|uniref:APH(6) family aminoglycoside O-phosphotransferase n=1 Tax=Microvirga puerhi TaxID=2876078 RepID=A0ABS7VU67_9HYPH|nr:aminoglycoside phosphotransferase family protein [Microvirga puerhi]MBZ6078600.1 hypothetical protein [Microvirga puerhi]
MAVHPGAVPPVFGPYLTLWRLVPDGPPVVTHSSDLLPVCRADGALAMLKIPREAEERRGSLLMTWWQGDGAARVLAHDVDALLLERATGQRSLSAMVREGRDDEASQTLCAVAAKLHAPRPHPRPDLAPLDHWFRQLAPAAVRYGGILVKANAVAQHLLSSQQDIVPLHGDIHHDNVLDFGPRGWLAIDPKGLVGERTFDFANILRDPEDQTAFVVENFGRRSHMLAQAAGVERTRLLQWTLAFAGLSAAWILDDGDEPTLDLAIAERAAAELSLR